MKMKDKIQDIVLTIIYFINHLVPKSKRNIVFYSMPDFSDNARAIYEKLKEIDNKQYYSITWVVSDVEKNRVLHPNINFVKHRSLKSMFAMFRAKYIIRTHSFWGNKYVRNRQIMCVAWHGMAIKGYTKEESVAPPIYFDHFCVTSPLFAEIFAKVMKCDMSCMDITGYPRNDNLFIKCPELIEELGLNRFKKVILWMPTFRTRSYSGTIEGEESTFGLPTIYKDEELVLLNDYLHKKNYCLVLKLHPWAMDRMKGLTFTNIRQLKNQDIPEPYSLYHFIGQTDALISDYSSVWGDYLLVDKPIGFAFDDLDEYKKTRIMPINPIEEYMPGMRIRNINELIQFLDSLDMPDNYIEEREKIKKLFISDCDNNSSLRFLKAIGIFNC